MRSIRNFIGFAAGLIIVATVAACMNGCSLVSKLESPAAQPFDAIAVAVGVDALVGVNLPTQAARATSIKMIAQEVLAADQGTQATLATLESVAAAKVTALQLPPGDAAAANLLIAVLSATVNNYVAKLGTTAIANEVQVDVAKVLGWVIAECNKYLPAATTDGSSNPFPRFVVVVRDRGRDLARS